MLSRVSSDAGTRLRRSKSTSTVHSNKAPPIEHLDHEVAHQHALAAATKAFVKAQAVETAAHTHNRSVELGRSKSVASRKSDSGHVLQREPSLRSTMRPQKPTSVLGVPRKSRVSTAGMEKFPPLHITPNTRAATVQPSITANENMRPSSQPKAQRPSVSSSMASQQIRKARSMYYASSVQTGSPLPRPSSKYFTTPPPIPAPPDESLLTSRGTDNSVLTSRSAEGYFERPKSAIVSPLPTERPPTTVLPNEAVDKARDKCLQDFQQQRQVKHKPSMFLAPFKKRQEKAKKKSAPSSAQASTRSHTPGDAASVPMVDSKPLKEKRSISDSLRSKFKKVFRKGSTKNTHLPAQQVDATREYYGGHLGDERVAEIPKRLDVPSPDELLLQRHKSRSPSFEGGKPALARASSRGSNRSLHSEASLTNATTSRVTSWSNSSACDTLTQRAIKRLTVIHESKDSMGSEADHFGSTSPRRKPLPMSGFAAFRDPMPMDTLMESTGTPVDPKRVFSALMKEIDATKNAHPDQPQSTPGGDSDVFVSSELRKAHSSAGKELGDCDGGDVARPLSSLRPDTAHSNVGSVKSKTLRSFGRALKATIRNVTPSEQPSSSSPAPDRTTSVRGAVRIPRPTSRGSSASTISDSVNKATKTAPNSITFKLQPRVSTPVDSQRLMVAATPVRSNALHVPKLNGRSRAPGDPTEVCTPAGSDISASSKEEMDSELLDDSLPGNPLRSPKPRQVFSPLSPSIYSRNTDGASILPNDSIMSLDATAAKSGRKGSISGSAVIITSHSVKSYVIGTPTPHRGTESARSSRDWKAWLSHEVSELGNLSTEDISIQYSTPTAHRREFTQISEEGSTVLMHELEGCSVSTPAPPPLETPTNQDLSVEPVTAFKTSTEDIVCVPATMETEERTASPDQELPTAADIMRTSTPNLPANFSRPRLPQSASASSSSSRMNERFPLIERGRRSASSTNSARLSRHTPSVAGSQSSSLKATPSPRVYSDFSAPSSIRIKHEGTKGPKRSGLSDYDTSSQKENVTPENGSKSPERLSGSPSASSLGRPMSLQPLGPSSLNRLSSNLAQYTTSAENLNRSIASKPVPSPRVRLRIRPVSPAKLVMRPKSAFDLRNSNSSSTLNHFDFSGGDSPSKVDRFTYRASVPVKPSASQPLSANTLRMMLESPWDAREQRVTPSGTGRRLHFTQSSSALARNKEPSPGVESRIIDAVLGDEGDDHFTSPRGGNVTPGQRMADRFLRERNAGGGAVTPVLPSTEEHSGPGTPVFL